MNKKFYTYSEIQIGDYEEFTKTISESDIYLFAGISGDNNPAHINAVRGAKSKFGGRIAHGILTSSLISTVLGTLLPGYGTIYLEQNLQFKNVVHIDDTITARVSVIDKLEKGRIKLRTQCLNQNNEEVIDGTALVIAPRDSQ